VYQSGYVTPLISGLDTAITRTRGDMEPFAAPVYEHAAASTVSSQLNRFLAVISNLYRSFLSKAKRAAIDVPLVTQLPPLAFFQNDGRLGPYTIPAGGSDADISTIFDTDIGVVSLPSTNKDHPLIWGALAHETGGHDVLHADANLLPELSSGVKSLFGGGPIDPNGSLTEPQFLGALWSYWMDEAASDVYGLLNLGPEFTFNLTAFFAGLNGDPVPSMRTDSGPDRNGDLDSHPTDILRLHLAIGVIQNLANLASNVRDQYVSDLQALSQLCAQGATTVSLQGVLGQFDFRLNVNLTRPLADMQESARRVGAFISTVKLQSLGTGGSSHSVQEIETWDDMDEQTAQQIAQRMRQGQSVVNLGDDAQLLAGATLALIAEPDKYQSVSGLLNDALDFSFQTDPIWGTPAPHGMISDARLAQRLKEKHRAPAERRPKKRARPASRRS
jgi:hypothetical protein